MNHLTISAAVLASALLALAAHTAQAADAPKAQAQPLNNANLLALGSPEMMLKNEPSAAGPRADSPAPLTRAEVIKELQRARAAGELRWQDREVTGFMR